MTDRMTTWKRRYVVLEHTESGIVHVARFTMFETEDQADLFVAGANMAVENHVRQSLDPSADRIRYSWAYADNIDQEVK